MTQLSKFNVSYGTYAVVSAAGLMAGEQLAVEFLACQDCEGEDWITYSPCGTPILIDEFYNPIRIATEGTYRVVPVGYVNSAVKVCVRHYGVTV